MIQILQKLLSDFGTLDVLHVLAGTIVVGLINLAIKTILYLQKKIKDKLGVTDEEIEKFLAKPEDFAPKNENGGDDSDKSEENKGDSDGDK